VPSSEEGSRIQLRHLKRAPRANPQYRMVLLNVMLALFITGIFSRYERQWAVCPQLKKVVPLLLLPLHGTVLIIDGDVFNRLALSEAALLGQNRGTVTRARQQRRSFSAFQSAKGLCALIYTNQPLSGSPFQRSFDQEEGWMPIIRRDLRSLWSLGCDAGRNRQRESTYRFGSGRRQASEQGCTARQAICRTERTGLYCPTS